MDIDRLKEKVLESHYPDQEELKDLERKYQQIARFIQREFDRETHFAGSASRGTCLRGDKDIDIFVLFPEELDEQELENQGIEIGKAVFEEFGGHYRIEYAEHPYTKGDIDDHEVEIVPCYDVEATRIKSSVDRTPHHSRWVKQNLTEEERKDVVVLKQFLKAENLYGSSLKNRGFSGYLCEILVHEYGGFEEIVREASNWRETEVVDPGNHHQELPGQLQSKFEDENLVVIDPVDPERNVASVLSLENYCRFIYRCWRFRNEPGMQFFEIPERDVTEFQLKQELKSRADFLVIEFEAPDEVDDIVYPQMRKAARRIRQKLESNSFRIFNSGIYVGEKARIFLELERELPSIEKRKGPKVFHGEDHLAQFTGKYENVFVEEDRLHTKVERDYTDAKELLKDFLEENLKDRGIPGNVAEEMDNYRFSDPLEGGDEWLKYLAKKLHLEED